MLPYTNDDTLVAIQNLPANGTYYDSNAEFLIPASYYDVMDIPTCNLELHVYDLVGNYLTGTSAVDPNNWYISPNSNSNQTNVLTINLEKACNDLGLLRGQYVTVINLHKREVGDIQSPSYFIKTLSTSRTELRLAPVEASTPIGLDFQQFASDYIQHKDFAINKLNRVFPVYDSGDVSYGQTNSGVSIPIFYFTDNAIRFAFDKFVTNQATNPAIYNGSTFIAINDYQTYTNYLAATVSQVAATVAWFIGANIKITPASIEKFALELINYSNSLAVLEYTAIQDLANLLKIQDFWRRNTDGTYKHIGQPYFNDTTLINAGYSILPYLYPADYILNFGNNNIAKVVNFAFESTGTMLVKLANPLDIQFNELDRLCIASELIRPLVEKILLVNILQAISGNTLRGPNFDIDVEEAQSIATSLKSWNDLLSANVNTNQQIIDKYFSGSLNGIDLNINYSEFSNFVHFSSAEERVANFKYKLQLIEYYTDRLNTLAVATGSIDTNSIEAVNKRNNIISGFDDFEKYLFYEPTGSQLYTHQSCSIQPWPKQNISSGSITYINQVSTTGSVTQTYYDDVIQQAQTFDRFNIHSLRNAVPVHINVDEFNAEYVLFVDMIGHYYDIIWSYIHYLTQVNGRQEHPADGMSQDLVFSVAKSLGLTMYSGKSAKDLWTYALGLNDTGEYITTGSLQSLSGEESTKEVWRRLINNLPYLYKTKGTARSIKALLTCYGIPTTILNIKEYGGVNAEQNDLQPLYIHDVYSYAKAFAPRDSKDVVGTPWQPLIRNQYNLSGSTVQYPDAIEFRVRTDDNYSYSIGTHYSLLRTHNYFSASPIWNQIQDQWDQPNSSTGSGIAPRLLDPLIEVTFKPINAHSGSIHLFISGSDGYKSASIDDVWMFDNNWLNVLVQRGVSTDATASNQQYTLKYQKGLYGKIVASGSSTIDLSTTSSSGSYTTSWSTGSVITWGMGGTNTATSISGNETEDFNGLLQEIRYWYDTLTDDTISTHTLSPSSYNGNQHYSAYYDLAYRASLTRKPTETGSFYLAQTYSQHPNQSINSGLSVIYARYSSSAAVPFEGVEETYYTRYADLTAHNIYSDKVRIESQSLSAPLSSDRRVTVSSFDRNSTDSNKLGIYFSPQNGINDDIVAHTGYLSLDDYIGDPRDQYKPQYTHLSQLQDEYWKKYQNKNDFAAYFRALSLYDLSVFKQIKKFVPARANLISGILVEPNLLERYKARTIKLPEVENLLQNASIDASEHINAEGIYDPSISILLAMPSSMSGSSVIGVLGNIITTYTIDTTPYTIGSYDPNTNITSQPNVVMNNLDDYSLSDGWIIGAQSTSANWNSPSPDTYDNGPVVVTTTANPNYIITQPPAWDGTLQML